MDYKKKLNKLLLILIVGSFVFYCSCDSKAKNKKANTYYVELVNGKFDSLQQAVSNGVFGKVSFYKNKQLQILSLNYVTDDLPEMHYFNNINLLKNKIEEGTKKIQVTFIGSFTYDSVKYNLQKFIYTNRQWKKTSDMGIVKTVSNLVQPVNKLTEIAEGIVTNIVQYSY